MRKALLLLVVLVVLVALGWWWYIAAARRVTSDWLACGADQRLLAAAADQEYWDEWGDLNDRSMLSVWDAACLTDYTIVDIKFDGRRASASVASRSPSVTFEDATEFPATASRSEKLARLKQRASEADGVRESTLELDLVLEGLRWRVAQDLEPQVQFAKAIREADEGRENQRYEEAILVLEGLLDQDQLTEDQRSRVTRERLGALAELACSRAVADLIKFPDAADYELSALTSIYESGEISVLGDVGASNAFGVKSVYSTSCDVLLNSDESGAKVDVFMLRSADPGSIITEDGIDVAW